MAAMPAKPRARTPAPAPAPTSAPAAEEPSHAFWLLKSEPDAFSWQQQVTAGIEPWTGIRNHQAAANLRAMRVGDQALFYHSNEGKEAVGIVEVARTAYPDPSDGTGKWVCVDVRTVGPLPRPVTLAQMKATKALEGFLLIRQSRLSVVPVSPKHWAVIAGMAGL